MVIITEIEKKKRKPAERHINYRSWQAMKARCYDKNNEKYKDYGGRGIIVCDRWLNSFQNFLLDMGEKPSKNYSLDRKNNDGNYEPSNCKWSTMHEQASNKRTNSQTIGVIKDKNAYMARIQINKKIISKSFKTIEEAIEYRKELELKYLNKN